MTSKNALQASTFRLAQKNILSASLDAELLLSFVLKKPREWILAHPEESLTTAQIKKFQSLIKKRAQHVPLAYLTREKEFYGRSFYVDERVLVPRPETEELISEIRNQKLEIRNNTVIIDVGTGSGCIIITLAHEFAHEFKHAKLLAVDVSKNALAVARKNARLHGVDKKIQFLNGSLLEPVFLKIKNYKIKNLIITANLPYLTPTELKQSPSIQHEPKLALAAGKDGLKYYKILAKQVRGINIPALPASPAGGPAGRQYPNIPISLYCEIGEQQGPAMLEIFSFAKSVEIKKDLAGRDRIIIAKI